MNLSARHPSALYATYADDRLKNIPPLERGAQRNQEPEYGHALNMTERKYMLPVFEPQAATLIVTCAESMATGVLKDFKGAEFDTKIRTLDQFQD